MRIAMETYYEEVRVPLPGQGLGPGRGARAVAELGDGPAAAWDPPLLVHLDRNTNQQLSANFPPPGRHGDSLFQRTVSLAPDWC